MSYCSFIRNNPSDTLNKEYHDLLYGFPLQDDDALFERLVLEINQAGLSWDLILKRSTNFHRAYNGFRIDIIALYTDLDRARLLSDAGVIRNRLKINAAIENARRIQALRVDFGSFRGWLDAHHPRTLDDWVRVFKKAFVFTGPEIVREFLLSTGYLPGAHDPDCPVLEKISTMHPPWMR